MRTIELATVAISLIASLSYKMDANVSLIKIKSGTVAREMVASPMSYTDLTGKSIDDQRSVALDLNNDGQDDILFRTEQVIDAKTKQTKMLYLVESTQNCSLMVDTLTEQTAKYRAGQPITLIDQPKNNWYSVVSATLMRKVTGTNGATRWEGNWKDGGRQFLPFQVGTTTGNYTGWIELQADPQTEKITLYRSAISAQPNVAAKAGY